MTDLASKARMDAGIEFIRVVACFMVVLLHVAASGFSEFGDAWWPSNFLDAFTRVCVPLFLMVTGALLLGRREPLRLLLRGRVLRLLPPLLFWSLFYVGWRAWRSDEPFVLPQALASLPAQPSSYHLWYLYALVGITLFLPFLRLLWQHAGETEKRFYLAMWLAVSGLPLWQDMLGWEADPVIAYELSNFFGLAGYLFLGAWLQEMRCGIAGGGRTGKAYAGSLLLFVLASAATMLATAWLSQSRGSPDVLFYDYLSPFVIVAAAGSYLFLAWSADRLFMHGAREGLRKGVLTLSALTLGIYCIHISWLEWVMDRVDWDAHGMAAWWMMPGLALLLFTLSGVSIALLRKVRPLRYVM
ncbi:surface polysaccharide O-acyltransferase-like enzyme [Paracandidimonas soli]|uniref:Surface polysaccharide O-acyltransferase-like enzyme n=2 Tax=Paracandidimonas soli TaxID=1917182 RepID=A0A4R3V9I5_9BURK|nr:surface polysaccharide O-acyltransferase-like enzyme [Paracandidimonas soli]